MPQLNSSPRLARDLLLALAVAAVALLVEHLLTSWGLAEQLAVAICAGVGALLIAYGVRRDVHGSRAEQAERRLKLAQDETGVGLFELDYRAGTAYASPALCQILGQPVMDGSMPLQQWLTALGAGHVEESLRTVQQKVAAGQLRYERELRVQLPNGQEHWLLSRIRLDLDAQGELATARGATIDITARKQLLTELEAALAEKEQALSMAREAQSRFEVALHSSSVAFTILAPVRDEDGRIVDFTWTYANPAAAALIGRPAEQLVGRRVLDVLPHAWREPGFFERYVRVSEEGCTAEFETRTLRSGPEMWLHVILSPLNGSVVVWFSDITQRRAQQQALQDADRRKDQFLATLAHELRNPLAPIRNAAAIVRDAAASAPQREWSLTVIERQLAHMALLLDDLLDVSRVTRGSLPLRRVRSALRPLVETAVETARPLFNARQHRLVMDLPEQPVWLDVDPMRIAQVVGNLLLNAAKYTEPGGVVRISARREDGEIGDVVLEVTDNGIGLKPEDCERVFEMFTQVPVAEGRAQGGLGIGLALARNLVEMHGGQLHARSAGLGLGSTFTARLPASATTDDRASEAPAATVAMAARVVTRRRILVADDNRDAADSLALLLEMQGHEVEVAYDGEDALARYRSFRPQVALLDLGMPEHSGTEVATLIRAQQREDNDGDDDAAITLVAITGFGQPHDRQAARAAGFDHHMTKPVEFDHLLSLLERVGSG